MWLGSRRVRHLSNHFLENDVRVFGAEVPFDELLRVQKVVDLVVLGSAVLVPNLTPILVIDVGNKAVSQLFDVVDGDVDVHLLLCILHEVVLWQAVVHDLLRHNILIILWLV